MAETERMAMTVDFLRQRADAEYQACAEGDEAARLTSVVCSLTGAGGVSRLVFITKIPINERYYPLLAIVTENFRNDSNI